MGRFTYDATLSVDFDDRVLAHLQAVIGAKLRRGESFMFTWTDDVSLGSGHTSVWLNPTSPISFTYFGNRAPALNRRWIEQLMMAANSTSGLQVVPEPNGNDAKGSELETS